MNGALHQTVALEAPQGLGKHFLRNASDFPLQPRVTHRPARENLDDESGPFIRDSIQHKPGRALRFQDRRRSRRFSHRFLLIQAPAERNIPNRLYSPY
jgi:hypothetical protein